MHYVVLYSMYYCALCAVEATSWAEAGRLLETYGLADGCVKMLHEAIMSFSTMARSFMFCQQGRQESFYSCCNDKTDNSGKMHGS